MTAAIVVGALATPATPGFTHRRAVFSTPSGNIVCGLHLERRGQASAHCTVLSTRCAGVSGTFSWAFAMRTGHRPIRYCPDDLEPATDVLAYGRSVRVGSMACTSERRGLTCRDRSTGHGFFLSRQTQRIF